MKVLISRPIFWASLEIRTFKFSQLPVARSPPLSHPSSLLSSLLSSLQLADGALAVDAVVVVAVAKAVDVDVTVADAVAKAVDADVAVDPSSLS